MRFYFEKGYPIESVLEYLLNLINSGFENWRRQNPDLSWQEFKFGVNDITAVAPIFDLVKLNDISKNLNISQPKVSHHLRILKDSKVVKAVKQGKNVIYDINDEHISEIIKLGLIHVEC